ncbi:Lactonase, 7-bladed beta-propeller-domain-containing protein [Colletotrichum godetiae]|uniref:Lactonase, 7-bladed beta-propeller-domain-containing protein n=1 Tax=Colletotrichum godetiae TaxID=1209918 RepID=A0AAJ0AJ82_9PEZI|nr:Lactonase, 7-bladed beta-propeller-domain-containing protein [Colletotrichum godetiae]KAK1674895.1 Lactonase, 7-bladed beta-propeller-domain-containing protein [Colletotrichum godetiae]
MGNTSRFLACFTSLRSALAATLIASHYSGQLYTLNLSSANQLTIASSVSAGNRMPAWLDFDPGSKTIYLPDEVQWGQPLLKSFSVTADGSLTPKGQVQTAGGELHSTLYGLGNGYITTAQYDASTISTYTLPLGSTGQPLQKLSFTMSQPGPVPSRQDRPHPHSVFTDPTGKYVLSADLGADLIRVFSIGSSGNLTQCPSFSTGPGDGPRHGAFRIQGNATFLFTVNELSNSLTSWSVTYPTTGCLILAKKQTLSTFPPGKAAPAGSKAAEVHVKDNFVYASNRNDQSFGAQQDSITSYTIEPSTGLATYLETTSAHSFFPRTFSINGAGTMVAIGGQTSANVAIVERNTTTGRLGKLLATVKVGNSGTVNQEDGLSAVIWNE